MHVFGHSVYNRISLDQPFILWRNLTLIYDFCSIGHACFSTGDKPCSKMSFKAAQVSIIIVIVIILAISEMTMCNVKEAVHTDKT